MQEKRRHFRKAVHHSVEFSVATGERRSGVCRDFSLGGMQIDTEEAAPFGANVTIFIKLKSNTTESALPGIVRWVKPGSMGIQFGLLGARETYGLSEMLSEQ